jgi:hypothetical protein
MCAAVGFTSTCGGRPRSVRRVEFHQEPTERSYGIDEAFRDPFGNAFRITQRSAVTAG